MTVNAESIKCHNIDISNYIEINLLTGPQSEYNDDIINTIFKSANFNFFLKCIQNMSFFYFCAEYNIHFE